VMDELCNVKNQLSGDRQYLHAFRRTNKTYACCLVLIT
jgi:hypothetical protein